MTGLLTETAAWRALDAGKDTARKLSIAALVENEEGRADRMALMLEGVLFDFTRHLVDAPTLDLLVALAEQQDVAGNFRAQMAGEIMNVGEGRAALHTALRAPDPAPEVRAVLEKIKSRADALRHDAGIRDIVHIGIGGSDLGPRLVCDALGAGRTTPRVHFAGSADPDDLGRILHHLDPARTLFTIASKTFTTQETMLNFAAARAWLGGDMKNVLAATVNVDAARAAGIPADNIFPLWDWVGGRFSVWSSIGLPIALACGYDVFAQFLRGGHAADRHVSTAPYRRNIPVLMALLAVWYRNFMGCAAHAVLPYSQRLAWLPAYVQQLDMESNGKRVNRRGRPVEYETAPVVFGGSGNNAQHAYMQILYQGTNMIPADFIGVATPADSTHAVLMANMLAQGRSLMIGDPDAGPHAAIPGNSPSSAIILPALDAYNLGLLMAVMEHKTTALGYLWDINSFDQFGVELGKNQAKLLLAPGGLLTQNEKLDKSTNKQIFHTFLGK